MAIFFFLVSLEIKREFIQGELSNPKQALLPIIAAVGGMLVPALIYVAINFGDPITLKGWAIPSDVEIVMDIFSDYNEQVKNIIKATPRDELFKWGIFARAPSDNWSSEYSTLLGDAAHPLEPFMGQGASMAIEDGVVISRIIADSGSQKEIVDRYQKARIERAHFVTENSKKAGMRFTGKTPDDYSKEDHKNEEELGLFYYDPSTVEI